MSYSSASSPSAAPVKRLSFDRAIRKLFPSTSLLTFNPLFKAAINAFDVVPKLVYPEFRGLPPNHLRVRIGVGNRILNNQVHFLVHARDFWMFVFTEGLANAHSSILDIGSGCGRWAHWLRDYNFRGRRFTGRYVGIDIDPEAIAWCKQHYDAERFRFHHSTDASVSYHQQGEKTQYRVPEPDGTFDLVVSNSLLTHVLEAELENYIRESYRLLKPGGAIMHSHFNLDYPPATYGTRHTFQHTIGNARVESLEQPEAAVAYRTEYLFKVARAAGFKDCEIVHMPGGVQHQPMLLCKK
ncbi:MAG: methyltransferase domain-containing protein [Pseudolabrys sp.]